MRVVRRSLPLFGRAVVLERDRIVTLPEVVQHGVVRVRQSDPNGPVVRAICGHVVENLVVGEGSSFLLLIENWDLVVHHVLIEKGALAWVDLDQNHPRNRRGGHFDASGRLLRGYLSPGQNEHEYKQSQ